MSSLSSNSEDDARRVKDRLLNDLGNPGWLQGAGLTRVGGVTGVRISVSELTDEARAKLPAEIDGVPIQVVVAWNPEPR
jgi:hypothetical protein